MTTSGTATFTYNRDQIIKMAYRKLGVINASETPGPQLIQDASDALNLWVKALNATGLHIWTETEATLFLQPRQVSRMCLGAGTTDHATESYTATTLAAAASGLAPQRSVVTSATGFRNDLQHRHRSRQRFDLSGRLRTGAASGNYRSP
jgi:hypothetical protein